MPCQNKVAPLVAIWFALVANAVAEPHVSGSERFPDRAGEILYSGLGCGSCHEYLEATGPSLSNLSSRVNHTWVVDFLEDPKHERMPAMFEAINEEERPQAIRDVTAWLGTLGDGLKLKDQRHSNAERGSALYHEIGCVACHAPSADFKPARTASPYAVPMPDLKEKTSLLGLQHFLSNTGDYRIDQRMPQFPLTEQESLDIAAHLLDFQSSDPREAAAIKPWPKVDAGAIGRGKQLVVKLNCASCHTLPGIEPRPIHPLRVPIEKRAGKCLTGEGRVRYGLSEKQQLSLVEFLNEDAIDRNDNAGGFSTSLASSNCYACHARHGIGGPLPETDSFFVGDVSLGDAGRLPPPLTGIGIKLQRDWLRDVMAGKKGTRVRPYLKTRMPVYSESAAGAWVRYFQKDLPHEGGDRVLPEIAKVDDPAAGKKLLGTHGGVNCITCHRWGDRPSLGIQGMDISSLDERMNSQWFRQYLLEPGNYRSGTLMPALWPGGKSTITDVLDGDTEQQIGAIWAFIRDGEGFPGGFTEQSAGQFELIPKDRPIVQRTFMEGVGTHAILVGFPGGISLAYDGEKAEPRLVWRGRFFNAYNTWFSRFAPFEKPLEKTNYRFGENAEERRFLGYNLDAAGNPTFLLTIGGRPFEEHYAVRDKKLIRTVRGKKFGTVRFAPLGGKVEAEFERSIASGTVVITQTYSWK